jgi:fibro-slime domain-containing protein
VAAVGLTAVFAHLVQGSPPVLDASPEVILGESYDAYRSRARINMPMIVRDFRPSYLGSTGGHPDFFKQADDGAGRYMHVASNILGLDGKPVLNSHGYKLATNWRDAAARNIIPTKSYITAMSGDVAGACAAAQGGAVTSAASFAQWFRDVPTVNSAVKRELQLVYDPVVQAYVFAGTFDNWRGDGTADYNYSVSLDETFLYEAGQGWYASLATNGDAWLYVDDKLVIDGGSGVSARSSIVVQDTISIANQGTIRSSADGIGAISTNSTAPGAISIDGSAQIIGDVMVGPGSDPAIGIDSARADSITGSTGTLGGAMIIDVVQVPSGMPPSVGNVSWVTQVRTISGDMHVDNFDIRNGSIITISGNVRILCEGSFSLRQTSQILIAPNSRLAVYAKGAITLDNSVRVNVNTMDPNACMLACLGASTISIDNTAIVYAHLVAPLGLVTFGNNTQVYGTITAYSAKILNTADFTGMGSFAESFGGATTSMTQRIDLDRLGWLSESRTHRLRLFFTNRAGRPSTLRLETNMLLMKLAVPLAQGQND